MSGFRDAKLQCLAEGCTKPADYKKVQLCQNHYMQQRRERKRPPKIPGDLGKQVSDAKTTEDWQRIAAGLGDVIQAIADGRTKGTAAQVALLKDIMNRAHGKPQATQEEKQISTGVVILPALDTGHKMTICPRCGYGAEATLETESRAADGVSLVSS